MLVKLELLTNKYTTLLLNRANQNISLTFHLLKYVSKKAYYIKWPFYSLNVPF